MNYEQALKIWAEHQGVVIPDGAQLSLEGCVGQHDGEAVFLQVIKSNGGFTQHMWRRRLDSVLEEIVAIAVTNTVAALRS
jgi:hypothetical protein